MKHALVALVLTMSATHLAAASSTDTSYRSTTAEYVPYREAPMADWRSANDAMAPMHGQMMSVTMGHMMGESASSAAGQEADMPPGQSAPSGMGDHPDQMGGQP